MSFEELNWELSQAYWNDCIGYLDECIEHLEKALGGIKEIRDDNEYSSVLEGDTP